jgi:hypothetical protein
VAHGMGVSGQPGGTVFLIWFGCAICQILIVTLE